MNDEEEMEKGFGKVKNTAKQGVYVNLETCKS